MLTTFLVILSLAATACPSAPKYEICLLGDLGCFCNDKRLPKDERDYPRPYEKLTPQELDKWAFHAMTPDQYSRWVSKGRPAIKSCLNYVATNPDDFNAMQEYCKKNKQ